MARRQPRPTVAVVACQDTRGSLTRHCAAANTARRTTISEGPLSSWAAPKQRREGGRGLDLPGKGFVHPDEQWTGHHPLVVSLANTGEPLYLVNRRGNRPSSEGAVHVVRTSRRLVFRLLAWNPWQAVLLRACDDCRQPLRCSPDKHRNREARMQHRFTRVWRISRPMTIERDRQADTEPSCDVSPVDLARVTPWAAPQTRILWD